MVSVLSAISLTYAVNIRESWLQSIWGKSSWVLLGLLGNPMKAQIDELPSTVIYLLSHVGTYQYVYLPPISILSYRPYWNKADRITSSDERFSFLALRGISSQVPRANDCILNLQISWRHCEKYVLTMLFCFPPIFQSIPRTGTNMEENKFKLIMLMDSWHLFFVLREDFWHPYS